MRHVGMLRISSSSSSACLARSSALSARACSRFSTSTPSFWACSRSSLASCRDARAKFRASPSSCSNLLVSASASSALASALWARPRTSCSADCTAFLCSATREISASASSFALSSSARSASAASRRASNSLIASPPSRTRPARRLLTSSAFLRRTGRASACSCRAKAAFALSTRLRRSASAESLASTSRRSLGSAEPPCGPADRSSVRPASRRCPASAARASAAMSLSAKRSSSASLERSVSSNCSASAARASTAESLSARSA
mmetsp:Transcript_51572/g.159999  ORF Transcript_51572/g.159999 Transcript_51572/m.159999 type:complete len:264 (-) Transcript_51572:444-1235(-)